MKSNIVTIRSTGDGFRDAHLETENMAVALPEEEDRLQLCLITEELLSLFNSVTRDLSDAEFWLEEEEKKFTFHLSARQKLGNVQRGELIDSTTSGRNDAAKGFLGTLREIFVQALSVGRDIDQLYTSDSYSSSADLTDTVLTSPRWDKFERSVLLSITDNVSISIKGGVVDLTAVKQF